MRLSGPLTWGGAAQSADTCAHVNLHAYSLARLSYGCCLRPAFKPLRLAPLPCLLQYISAPGSPDRRACQTVLAALLEGMLPLIAPLLPHMAEDAWQNLPYKQPQQSGACLCFLSKPSSGRRCACEMNVQRVCSRALGSSARPAAGVLANPVRSTLPLSSCSVPGRLGGRSR